MLKTFVLLFQDSLINRNQYNYFEIEVFCNILNVFTDSFDHFNGSLLNKIMNFTTNFGMVVNMFEQFYRLN